METLQEEQAELEQAELARGARMDALLDILSRTEDSFEAAQKAREYRLLAMGMDVPGDEDEAGRKKTPYGRIAARLAAWEKGNAIVWVWTITMVVFQCVAEFSLPVEARFQWLKFLFPAGWLLTICWGIRRGREFTKLREEIRDLARSGSTAEERL